MDYEVPASRLERSGRAPWRHLAVALLGPAVVGAAVLGGVDAARPDPAPQSAVVEPPTLAPTGTPRTPWTIGEPGATLAPPRTVDCTTLGQRACDEALLAARRVVWPLAGAPRQATVHASLVCGSYRDCPRALIADGTPIGSVVLAFEDGRETWVNVIRPPRGPLGRRNEAVGLVVRWVPPG